MNLMYLVIVLLSFILGLFGSYLTQYFVQKGKNLADRQDIEDLTRKVEEIKLESSSNLAKINAHLSALTERKRRVFSDELDSVMAFYTELNSWFQEIGSTQLHEFNLNNFENIQIKLNNIRKNYDHVNVAFSKIELLIDFPEVNVLGRRAIMAVLNYHHKLESSLTSLKWNLGRSKSLIDVYFNENNRDKISGKLHIDDFIISQAKSIEDGQKEAIESFTNNRTELSSASIDAIHEFKIVARAYIRA